MSIMLSVLIKNYFDRFGWYTAKPITEDPNKKYINNSREKFLNLLNGEKCSSSNIDDFIYNKKTLYQVLTESNNDLERSWRTRVLMETTPIGNIVMFYDIFKHGFSYYSDQPIVSYDMLNSIAMKYVVRFSCLDFFMDEYILGDIRRSPLKSVFIDDDEKDKEKKPGNELAIDLKTAPFAKLKNYSATSKKDKKTNSIKSPVYFKTNYLWLWKMWFRIQYYVIFPIYKFGIWSWSSFIGEPKQIQEISPSELSTEVTEKEKIRNKFIYLGRFRNFNILQKPPKSGVFSGELTKYDSMFGSVCGKAISYKDFKNGNVD